MISLVKIGGHVIDDEAALKAFCKDFAALEGPKVLVHGGGALAGALQKRLGIPERKIDGRRVTDAQTLEVVTMVYAGWCNKHITALLQAEGCRAIGLAGCDADVVRATRRAPVETTEGVVDFGLVGDVRPEGVNAAFLQSLLEQGLTPVLCAINHDGQGGLLNTNADTVASCVCAALGAKLIYCFEKAGVLRDPENPSTLIPHVDSASCEALKAEGVIQGGMIPKLDTALRALRSGACGAVVKQASALLDPEAGTRVSL